MRVRQGGALLPCRRDAKDVFSGKQKDKTMMATEIRGKIPFSDNPQKEEHTGSICTLSDENALFTLQMVQIGNT